MAGTPADEGQSGEYIARWHLDVHEFDNLRDSYVRTTARSPAWAATDFLSIERN